MSHLCPTFQKRCDITLCQWWRRMQEQKDQALSTTNRYYFWLNEKRDPVDDAELILYYADNGGARDYYAREHGG